MVGKRKKVKITYREIDEVLTAGKECTKCGEWKPLDEFHKGDSLGGRQPKCKSCRSTSTGKLPKLETRVINGEAIIGKKCTKCGEWKPLETGFHKGNGLGGRKAVCKSCRSTNTGKRLTIETEVRVINGEIITVRKCTKCGEWKPLETSFYRKKGGSGDRFSVCIDCLLDQHRKYREENKEKIAEYRRRRYEENKEKLLEYYRKYYEKNKEKHRYYTIRWQKNNHEKAKAITQRRRARKRGLPDNWTLEQQKGTWEYFNNACALTGEGGDIHEDHVIPLAVGHGGTTYGNMIPLRADLNDSKCDRNIFEWFSENRERFNLSEERFNRLIEYLATINGLTVDEYRQFVYWCHENPRNEDEIVADPRHSIEIWREATGRHFPLPAYAIENDNMSDNERSAS